MDISPIISTKKPVTKVQIIGKNYFTANKEHSEELMEQAGITKEVILNEDFKYTKTNKRTPMK